MPYMCHPSGTKSEGPCGPPPEYHHYSQPLPDGPEELSEDSAAKERTAPHLQRPTSSAWTRETRQDPGAPGVARREGTRQEMRTYHGVGEEKPPLIWAREGHWTPVIEPPRIQARSHTAGREEGIYVPPPGSPPIPPAPPTWAKGAPTPRPKRPPSAPSPTGRPPPTISPANPGRLAGRVETTHLG